MDGTSFYFEHDQSAHVVQVWSLKGGVAKRRYAIPEDTTDPCVGNSVIVSPDGQWLAWVTGTGEGGGIGGTLSVSGLDGKNARTLNGVVCAFNEFTWTADSHQLKIHQVGGRVIAIDARTGAIEPATIDGVVWSANRAFNVRRASAGNSFVVQTADGRVVRTIANYRNDYGGFDTCGFTLKGISDNGRYVAIGGCATDPSRVIGAFDLFDTEANRHVALPVPHVDGIAFFAGGTVLLHSAASGSSAGRLTLMTEAGSTIATVNEPVALQTARFLSYTPAA